MPTTRRDNNNSRPEWLCSSPTTKSTGIVIPGMARGAEYIARQLVRGGRVVGLTDGRFSLLDILRSLLDVTGPADVTIAAWTAGIRDSRTAAWLMMERKIKTLRWLIDRSFIIRQPEYAAEVLETFGPNSLIEAKTHAKFLLIEGGGWSLVVRSSMNLNKNVRIEHYDIDDSPEIFSIFSNLCDDLASTHGRGLGFSSAESGSSWDRLLSRQGESGLVSQEPIQISMKLDK